MPDVKWVKKENFYHEVPANQHLFSMFQEIAAYATEKVLGILLERKGRKWFRKPHAPIPGIEAEKSKESVKQAIEQDGCWGCKGIGVHTGIDRIDNPSVCTL